MSTYVITGASKGIGLELCNQLLALPSTKISHVFALSRSKPTPGLQSLINVNAGRITHVTCAVDSDASVRNAADEVSKSLNGKGLDVLVNNAGLGGANSTFKMQGESSQRFLEMLNTNVVGVHRMTAAFLALLRTGREKKVMNITSTLGSIGWADHFAVVPTQAYKTSKAALNMLSKQYAIELAGKGFIVLAISPGHLKTDLGGDGDFDVEVGTKEVVRIMSEATPEMNGKAVNIHVPGWENAFGKYDGGEIPW